MFHHRLTIAGALVPTERSPGGRCEWHLGKRAFVLIIGRLATALLLLLLLLNNLVFEPVNGTSCGACRCRYCRALIAMAIVVVVVIVIIVTPRRWRVIIIILID